MTWLLVFVGCWAAVAVGVVVVVHRWTRAAAPTPPFPPDPRTTWAVPDDLAGLQAELDGAR